MIRYKIVPRFNDTDCLGHINNAVFATWFEEARIDFFRMFIPTLSPADWNLIVARVEIDYLSQGYFQFDAVIESSIERIGNSSFTILQKCYQQGKIIAKGKVFLVHYDYQNQKSVTIPEKIKEKLKQHLILG